MGKSCGEVSVRGQDRRGIDACLGPELDGVKPWRGQCSGPGSARIGEKNGRKLLLLGIQRPGSARKMRGIEARLGPELDGAKPWRGQCSGPRNRGSCGARTRWGKAVARSVLGGIEARLGPELDGENSCGEVSVRGQDRREKCEESFGARTRWGKAVARSVLGARSGEKRGNGAKIGEKNGRKLLLSYRDSEGAFGTQSPRNRGLSGARTRWGKAVARSVFGANQN